MIEGVIHIQVDLKPTPKARPRFNPRSGRPYTPKSTTDFESLISFFARNHFVRPMSGAVEIIINFSFIKAKSSKLVMHTKKPDIDNLIKSVCDGLNKIAYKDDSQIVKLASEKIFADRDGIDIYIKELNSDEEEIRERKLSGKIGQKASR